MRLVPTTPRPNRHPRHGRLAATGLLATSIVLACERTPSPEPGPTPPEASAPMATAATPTNGPRLELDQSVVDFGRVADHETRNARVLIRNTGDRPLTVRDLVPTCGCTTTRFETPATIPAGGESAVVLDFDPRGSGRQEKYVRVVSDDPQRPNRTIKIRAEVIATLTAEPRFLALGRAEAGAPVMGSVEITAALDGCSLDFAKLDGDLATHATSSITRLNDPAEPRGVWRVDVNFDDTVPWGWHTGSMLVVGTVETETGERPITMNFAMNGSFEGAVIANETMLGLQTLRPGQPIERETTILRADGRPLACLSATIVGGPPGIEARIEPLDATRTRWRLRLEGAAPVAAGTLGGTVVVTTDTPENPVLAFRFAGIVR